MNEQKENNGDFKKIALPKLKLETIERKQIWEPRQELIVQAYDKILDIWNKDQKSRNFIKHLVASFLPIDQWSRAFNINPEEPYTCAILNIKLAGMKNISEGLATLSMTRMFIEARIVTEDRKEYSEAEKKEFNDAKASIPSEILNAQVAYLSDKSDKTLSQEAVIALRYFTEFALFESDELLFTLKKKQIKQAQEYTKNKLTDKQVNKVAKASTFNVRQHIDDDTFSALSKLKNELEESEKVEKE
jgi:hypothetical protein